MKFIKYNADNKPVIQPAAMILSNMDASDKLQLHAMNHAIVLLKEDMTSMEKTETMVSLMRLVGSLSADLMYGFVEDDDEDCEDEDDIETFGIPIAAFESAGILGNNLRVVTTDGAVLVASADDCVPQREALEHFLTECGIGAAAIVSLLKQLAERDGDEE